MGRRSIAPLLALAALASVVPVAEARRASKSEKPTITRVTPMRVSPGETIVIRGKRFKSRKRSNTVIFQASNRQSAFAKPRRASRRRLVVRVPAATARLLDSKPARFRLRVLAGKFSSFTPKRLSPVVVPFGAPQIPAAPGAPGAPDGPAAPGDPGTPSNPEPPKSTCVAGDFDGDLLTGSRELEIGTDPCLADTDGDGIEDGYEQQSAIDLNHYPSTEPLPYPGKRPYPNALDPSDANTDYDGDGLTLREEFLLWRRFSSDGVRRSGDPASLSNLLYSDGLQRSQGVFAAPMDGSLLDWALDDDEDGQLHDGERDGDGDGLSNWDEASGRMTEGWWVAQHDGKDEPKESKYPEINFLDNDDLPDRDALADPDIDGDGILDGADDADHDGLSNQFELRRPDDWQAQAFAVDPDTGVVTPGPNPWAYTQPFNPCKPFDSERCHRYTPPGYYDGDGAPPVGPPPPDGYPDSRPTTPNG